MNFQTKTTTGHGFFRKSKAYGLVCGIALLVSGLVLVSQNVSADTWVANSPSQITIAEGDTSY
ncbi:putative cross-wall-targeting lipoprotein signal domain-containing protein, partial [Streptococcus suis]